MVDNAGKDIGNVEDLLDNLKAIRNLSNKRDYDIYFRGMMNCGWRLKPSIIRSSRRVRSLEDRILIDLRTKHQDDFIRSSSSFSQWVLAQQHGLPTRLLDITRDPLVALFFACYDKERFGVDKCDRHGVIHVFCVPKKIIKPFDSDSVSVISNYAKLRYNEKKRLMEYLINKELDFKIKRNRKCYGEELNEIVERLYGFIGQEKSYFTDRIKNIDFFQIFLVNPQESFERLHSQSGAFLLSAFQPRFEKDNLKYCRPSLELYEYHKLWRVKGDRKSRILRQLEELNITYDRLFPGIEPSVREIKRIYRINED